MASEETLASHAEPDIGARIHALVARLYPICRSITGDGVRETLSILGETLPLEVHEVASGTEVFDWTVPKEWNIRDAYIKDSSGRRVVDFHAHNLHVVSYSTPVRASLSLAELRPHLHSLPDRPDWIPYRTTYYDETWGFCVRHRTLASLPEDRYEVVIDATLEDGSLAYGELLLPGTSAEEVLIFSHLCHPSMCNDNLSGLAVTDFLAKWLAGVPRRYSYRFVWAPGTIGSITWLHRNQDRLARIRHGLVLVSLGDPGPLTYKQSRGGDAEIDRAVAQVLNDGGSPWQVMDFEPYGYDERQFCSPGVNLPVGRLTRSPNGSYPEYHTSADDLDFVTAADLRLSYETCARIIQVLEANQRYQSTNPMCEPQLGKRGLYEKTTDDALGPNVDAILWLLNLSDGGHDLLAVAERSGLAFEDLRRAAARLVSAGLLIACEDG